MKKTLNTIFGQEYLDIDGRICIWDKNALPFVIKRVFVISDVQHAQVRANHANMKNEEAIICVQGGVRVEAQVGKRIMDVKLTPTGVALHVPSGAWIKLSSFDPYTILVVLCSEPYDPDDYIYDYVEWKKLNKERT